MNVDRSLWFPLSGSVGAFVATLSDAIFHKEASAVVKISDAIEVIFQISFSRVLAMCLIVALGTVLVSIFGATTRKGAFYIGAGVISFLMTFVPYDVPPSVRIVQKQALLHEEVPPVEVPVETEDVDGKTDGSFLEIFLPNAFAGDARRLVDGSVALTVTTADNKTINGFLLTIKRNPERTIVAQSKVSTNSVVFSQIEGSYVLIISTPGYAVEEQVIAVRSGITLRIEILLKPSLF